MTAHDGALGHRARNGSFHFRRPGATGAGGGWLPAGVRVVVLARRVGHRSHYNVIIMLIQGNYMMVMLILCQYRGKI